MKAAYRSAPALAVALLLATAVPALADTTPGWYADFGAGGTFTPRLTGFSGGQDRTADFKTGWNALGGAGYAWDNGFRTEGEVFYNRADIKSVEGAPGATGRLSNLDFFVNGLYDINLHSMFTPYVGVGVGLAVPMAKGTMFTTGATNDSDAQFAYQGIVGVAAQLDPNWAVTADYRYIASTNPTFSTAGGNASMENASHNVIVGIRYSFGEPAPVMAHASAPAPHYKAPAKASVPAPVPQSYMVFFDFNKSTLTPEAETILNSVASDYKSGKYKQVDVAGHTDTVGTEAYNQKLSVHRADVVKKELIKLGVPAKAIAAEGLGKKGLLVPTADGVREAQNRRAEIMFGSK